MATTVNSDVILYDDVAYTAYLELIQDNLNVFNGASSGAIVRRNELIRGDFMRRSFFLLAQDAVHRDPNSSADATASKFTGDERVSVKCPWGYGPIEATHESFRRAGAGASSEEFSRMVGQQLANTAIKYQVRAAMAALSGALGSNSGVQATGNWSVDKHRIMTKGLRTFGDAASNVVLWAMDSNTYFDLVDNAIAEKIYNEAGQVIYGSSPGTMGRPVLVSDLVPADTIFGLVPGAIDLVESQQPLVWTYDVNGRVNKTMGMQGEGVFNVEVLGYAWDVGGSPAAPANPNLSQLATPANWKKIATSDKATAGFVIEIVT
jgi:hypothetical protein